MTATDFIEQTFIEVVDSGLAPFHLWDGQNAALYAMEHEHLAVFLKARQLGISWIVCGYALWSGLMSSGQTVLAYSQGQLEANELARRVSVLYQHHQRRNELPALIRDNTSLLEWDNGFRFMSLAATRRAGRSFTASIVILDEWAFMAWPRQTLAAVKPTIDAGGKLFIISSADGQGSAYHQFWQHAQNGSNGYKAVFLPWFAHPDRGPDWRDQKVVEASGDTASVLREYPANDIEAFTAASGLVYDVWSDGSADGNVTDAAEYDSDAGPIYWAIDDGYAGQRDPSTGHYSADSHPRVFLLAQLRGDGSLNVFYEDYKVKTLSDQHIETILALPYPAPTYAAIDKSAAELRARLHAADMYTQNSPSNVDESIKELRRWVALDKNGVRRVKVHPRCVQLRYEMASYRYGADDTPVKQHDHGPDALRYLTWTMRHS